MLGLYLCGKELTHLPSALIGFATLYIVRQEAYASACVRSNSWYCGVRVRGDSFKILVRFFDA